MKSFQATAVEQLQNRWKETLFDQVDNSYDSLLCSDPRFRRLKSLLPERIISVQAKVQTEALAARREMVPQQQQETISTIRTAAEPSSSTFVLDSLHKTGGNSEDESRVENAEEDLNTQIINEVMAYFVERPLAKEENPLDWWRDNKDKNPTLAKLAKSYLCIPSTSTPSASVLCCR